MSTDTILTLKSSDNQLFTVEKEIAIKSTTLKNLLEDGCVSPVIPLPNLDSKILTLVLELLNKENDDQKKSIENLEISTLVDLAKAANYMEIKDMLDVVCQRTADLIKDKTVEDVRAIFGIVNDFTPEEEHAIRAEYEWAFEI
ncbi:hypothetical protein LXL04_017075 [Taraxacum kok-saghyz]